MLDHFIKFILSCRFLFIAALIACIVGITTYLPNLSYRVELHSLLKSDSDQTISDIREFYKAFPPSEGEAIVTVSYDRTITISDLRQTRLWVDELKALPQVKRVVSTFDSLLETKIGQFTLDQWVDLSDSQNDPVTLGTAPGIEVIHGTFISKDLKSLAFYIQRKGGMKNFINALKSTTAQWGVDTKVLGINVMLNQGGGLLKDELTKLIVLLLITLIIVLPILLKSFRISYLPMSISLLSVLSFLSILAYVERPITLMSIAAPLLITVISLSNSIHLQRYFDHERSKGLNVKDALKVMFQMGGKACFMTTLTTAIGFFSLLIVSHEEIREFGYWCGMGVVLTYFNIIFFFPLLLSIFPGKESSGKVFLIRNPERFSRYNIPISIALLLISFGITFSHFDTSIYSELPQKSQTVQDMKWYSSHFKGTERIEIEINGKLDDYDVFHSIANLQDKLSQIEGIKGSSSYTSLLRYISPPGLINIKDGVAPAMGALNSLPEYPVNLLNKKKNRACMIFYTSSDFGSSHFRNFKERFHELIPELSDKASYKMNGYVNMAYNSINYINDSLFYSLGISILAITLVLILYLRSISFALLCLVPNVLPIVATMGVAGWLNIPIGIGMIVILIIGLGLAVDDTVHLVIKFIQSKQSGETSSTKEHLNHAVATTGYAIIITSIVIFAAALAFLQSSFMTLRETGIVLGVVTMTAICADLFLFPWIIEHYYTLKNRIRRIPS